MPVAPGEGATGNSARFFENWVAKEKPLTTIGTKKPGNRFLDTGPLRDKLMYADVSRSLA